MRRRTSALAAVVSCACLGLAGQAAAVDTKLSLAEECSFTLLPKNGVALRTTFTLKNGGTSSAASIRLVAGWSIGRVSIKAGPTTLTLRPGHKAQRTVRRTLLHAPQLVKTLRQAGRFNCASTKSYTIG